VRPHCEIDLGNVRLLLLIRFPDRENRKTRGDKPYRGMQNETHARLGIVVQGGKAPDVEGCCVGRMKGLVPAPFQGGDVTEVGEPADVGKCLKKRRQLAAEIVEIAGARRILAYETARDLAKVRIADQALHDGIDSGERLLQADEDI